MREKRRSQRGSAMILVFALIVPVLIISIAAISLQRSSVMIVEQHAACARARLNAAAKLAQEVNKLESIDPKKPLPTYVDTLVREPIETLEGASVSLWARAEIDRDAIGLLRIKRISFFESPPEKPVLKERP